MLNMPKVTPALKRHVCSRGSPISSTRKPDLVSDKKGLPRLAKRARTSDKPPFVAKNAPSFTIRKFPMLELLCTEYGKHHCPANAAAMKQYMRNQFEFIGLKAPERRAIDKEVMKGSAEPESVADLREQLQYLWKKDEREYQMFAMDYAIKHVSLLRGNGRGTCEESINFVKELISTKSWWDTVDLISSRVLGPLVQSNSEHALIMDMWVLDDNMWVRRAAILHQLSYHKATDHERLFRFGRHEEATYVAEHTRTSWIESVATLMLLGEYPGYINFPGTVAQDCLTLMEHSFGTWLLMPRGYRMVTCKSPHQRYCLQCSHETEFFIQKAIGWALRTYHRQEPKLVVAFVKKNKEKLSKLSIREALKYAK